MSMNREIGLRWVTKLEEEGRRQTRGCLRDEGGQCCLDVLCEVAVEEGVINPPVIDFDLDKYEYEWRDEEGNPYWDRSLLPDPVTDWAGLDSNNPVVVYQGREYELAALNDGMALSFPEIAKLIKEQLIGSD